MDFSIFFKNGPFSKADLPNQGPWDLFISAYNLSDRVQHVFDDVQASRKIWLVHHEYLFDEDEYPKSSDELFVSTPGDSESQVILKLFNQLFLSQGIDAQKLRSMRICFDTTGFLRPHLLFMILYCYKTLQLTSFDMLYSEPDEYVKRENTQFSAGAITDVRFVDGFASRIDRDNNNDLLLIGAGFDSELIAEVADDKLNARKIQIVGFPSLQPEMYQQSRLKIHAVESLTEAPLFAPANDPFVTANVLSEVIDHFDQIKPLTNLYLSPIGTKAQTIGFAIFFIYEFVLRGRAGGIIFPVSEKYSKKTGNGYSKSWIYTIEFPFE